MDWLIIGGIFLAGWTMLSVLSGERMNRSQQIAVALMQKAKAGAEVPIALASESVKSVVPISSAPTAKTSGK